MDMYLKHFGLKAQPFQLTPDIGFLFMSEAHTRAKAYMDYTVWNREGFVVITGEIGCGKTTLIQKVLSELDENVVVAKIFQTQLDEVEFLQAMLVDFGLNPFNAKKVELLDMLNTFILEQFVQGKQIVLIVDDAHNLSTKVVEAAASELQWPSYSERVDKRRQKTAPSPVDSRLHDVLSEQSRALATIAEQVGNLEHLAPILASIRMSLGAIETSLRDFVQSQAGDPNSESASNSRKRTG